MEKADVTAVETALSTKANVHGRGYYTDNIDLLYHLRESWLCVGASGTLPPITDGRWFTLNVMPGGTGSTIQIACINSDVGSWAEAFIRHKGQAGWTAWSPLATATPPQVYALPLAAGWAESTVSTYFRNQFHEVTINFKVFLSAGSSSGLAVGLHTIAALPVGYRPSNPVYFVCAAADWSGAFYAGWVLDNGTVNVSVPTAILPKQLVGFAGSVSFAAG